MENERPDKYLPWRGQPSGPDALSGPEPDDNELSWQHLAERLNRQPGRLGPIWRFTAACLILVLFLPVTYIFRNHSTQPKPVTTHSAHPIPRPDRVTTHPYK